MSTENILQLALRFIPALIVALLAFVAANDVKTRDRWATLLYDAGMVRPEQRADAKVQRSVRLPFFLVALALLIWPVRFYQHATRTIEVKTEMFQNIKVMAPTAPAVRNATTPSSATPSSPPLVAPVPPSSTLANPAAPASQPKASMTPVPVAGAR